MEREVQFQMRKVCAKIISYPMTTRWTIQDIANLQAKRSAKPKAKLPGISANELTKHALRMLGMKGYHVWRQNNGGVWDPTLKVFRANSSTPGISDIIGFHKQTGRFIACEIKVGRDKLSTEQEQFLADVNRAGGIGRVIKNMTDLENLSKEI